ncbi:MAG: hypothetical protein ACERK6_00780 [Candidatus Aminicenantaceae bacterium]
MFKKSAALLLIVLLALPCLAIAQESPEPVLQKGDVERFIKTFPVLKAELEELGMKYEAEEGDYTVPEAVQASAEFTALLKKHDWDETFFAKMGTIFMGYVSLAHKKEMAQMDPEIEKAIKEIESTAGVSEAMKKQMVERLRATQKMMGGQQGAMQQSVHEADLELIRPLIPELRKLFEDED